MAGPTGLQATERELKIAVADLEPVRERLQALGAQAQSALGDERNWVFDRGADTPGELLGSGRLLRLRSDPSGHRLTYKGVARFGGSSGALKEREEREVRVDDLGQARALLLGLGYRVVRRYEKRREEWRLGGSTVALDETPIGAFVEVEGSDAEAVAASLGLKPRHADRRSYLALWDDRRRTDPSLGPDMLFPAR